MIDISKLRTAHAHAYVADDRAACERLAWAISYAVAGDVEQAEPAYNQYVKEAM
jgi:hypothetical protein